MAESNAEKSEAEAKAKAKPPAAKGPGHMKLVIVGAVALFLALVGAQVAGPLILKAIQGGAHPAGTAEGEQTAENEQPAAAEDKANKEEAAPSGPAIYTPMDPPFTVSFQSDTGPHYLQLTLQAMARREETIAQIKQHAPAIRNAFLFLLSRYELDELQTIEGKEKLRAAMLAAANEVMAKNGSDGEMEEIYFTNMVIQ